jgi:hypothetical protein
MPIVPSQNVVIPNQVLPDGTAPYTQQGNFGYLIGRVQKWNPDLTQPNIAAIINDVVRVIYDRRTWYGLYVKGQIVSPQAVTKGQVTATLGSNVVVGTGTAWTSSIIGLQFRIGYNSPIYTITDCDPIGQALTLELPWGAPTVTSGYFIVMNYANFGPNIKYIKTMLNVQLGIKFSLHATQDTLNTLDPWRQNQNFSWMLAGMPPLPDGSYQAEMYPASWIQQAYPFCAYIQPPNLVNDTDNLPAAIRGDVVVSAAIAEALVIGGPKNNKYYDAPESARKMAKFESELLRMANADDNLYRQDVTLWGEDLPYFQTGGALWNSCHAIPAGGAGGGGYDL